MKLIQYMRYLKKLHHKYGGDIEVKIKTTYVTFGLYAYEYEDIYKDAGRPRYDKDNECVVIHKERVSND